MTAQTIEACLPIRVDASVIIARIKSDPALALDLALIGDITLLPLPTAVRRAAEFEPPYRKSILANRLDMSPAVPSRALGALRRTGVTINRKTVMISSLRKLYRLVRRDQSARR